MINQASLLTVVILTGSVSIVAAQVLAPQHPLAGSIIPTLCVFAYVLVNRSTRCVGTTREQVADNTYFIGFIFTLASLVTVLFALADNGVRFDKVLANAGIAFITTLAGSTLRLLLIQGVVSLDDAQAIAEQSLRQATLRYSRALNESTEKLSSGHREHMERLNAVFNTSVDGLQQNINALRDTFLSSAAAFRETAVSVTRRLEQTMVDLSIPDDILSSRLDPMFRQVQLSVQAISQALQDCASDSVNSSKAMKNVLGVSEQCAREISGLCSELAASARNVQADTARAADIRNDLAQVVNSLHAMAERIDRADRTLGALHADLAGEKSPIRPLADSLARVNSNVIRLDRRMNRMQTQTGTTVSQGVQQ
jgi:methyl-accepting chemotaxis protein